MFLDNAVSQCRSSSGYGRNAASELVGGQLLQKRVPKRHDGCAYRPVSVTLTIKVSNSSITCISSVYDRVFVGTFAGKTYVSRHTAI